MKAARNYLNVIEYWDRLASEQHWSDGWTDSSSMAINNYLQDCIENNHAPTFKGFMLFLSQIAPKE